MRYIIFMVLKISEISAIIFIPYWVGSLVTKFLYDIETLLIIDWLAGLTIIMAIFGFLFILWVILSGLLKTYINANWRLAGDILRRLKNGNK